MKRRDLLKLAPLPLLAALLPLIWPRGRPGADVKAKVLVVGKGIAGSMVKMILDSHGVGATVLECSDAALPGPGKVDVALGLADAGDLLVHLGVGGGVVKTCATGIDPDNRLVYTDTRVYSYDILFLTPGVVFDYGAVEVKGRVDNFTPYELGSALAKRELSAGRYAIVHPNLPYRCTSAPYEFALLLDWRLREEGKPHSVTIISQVGKIPAVFEKYISQMGELVWKILEERGVEYINAEVELVDGENKVVHLSTGEKVPFDYLTLVPPNKAPRFISAVSNAEGFYVEVDERMRHPKYRDIYVAGDAVWHVVKTGWAAATEAAIAAAWALEDLGISVEKPKEIYSEDAIRITPDLGIRGAKRWYPIYGDVYWRQIEGPSPEVVEAKKKTIEFFRQLLKYY